MPGRGYPELVVFRSFSSKTANRARALIKANEVVP